MTALPPYAHRLGIVIDTGPDAGADPAGDGMPVLRLPPAGHLLGRPGFLHGGALAGLLEMAAILAARHALGDDVVTLKPIGITVDFLRGARPVDTRARARLIRDGARIAAVAVHAWQEDETRPVAAARMNLSLRRP